MDAIKIMGALLIVALIYILFSERSCNESSDEIVYSDTVTVVNYDTTYFDTTRFTYVVVDKPKTVYDTSYYVDSVLVQSTIYKDTVKNDSVSIFYRLDGKLNDLKLGYKLTYPNIVKTETKTITNTIERPVSGFYLGMDVDVSNFNYFTPNALYAFNNGWAVGGGYELKSKSIVFSVKKKLF